MDGELFSFDEQLKRLKSVTSSSTDTDLMNLLGVNASGVTNARKRGKIPDKWFVTISTKYGVDIEWLVYGTGSMGTECGTVTQTNTAVCSRCQKLEQEIALERESSRKKDELMIEWWNKVEEKIEEVGQLRLENMKLEMKLDTASRMCKEYQAEITNLQEQLSLFAANNKDTSQANTA